MNYLINFLVIYLGMMRRKRWYVYIPINIADWCFDITFNNGVKVSFHFNIVLYFIKANKFDKYTHLEKSH